MIGLHLVNIQFIRSDTHSDIDFEPPSGKKPVISDNQWIKMTDLKSIQLIVS